MVSGHLDPREKPGTPGLPASGIRSAEGRQQGRQRGLLLAAVAALLAFATCSPALAQETTQKTRGEKKYCTEPAPTAYQYVCDESRTSDCAPQQQYDDETNSCTIDPYQYGPCAARTPCSTDSQQDSVTEALPPASVQNVVVAAAKSVSEDAPEASSALDTAEPVDPANNVALAAEGEPAADTPTYPPETSEEAVGGVTPLPKRAAAPAETAEVTESAEAVADQKRELEEVDGDPAAFYGNIPVDQFVIPLFALGVSTLLIGGGLLVRRIVG